MKIGFASCDYSFGVPGPDGGPAWGGAGYYRMFLPAEACERAGHEVVTGSLIASNTTGQLGVQRLEKLTWIDRDHPAFPQKSTMTEAPLWEGSHHWDFDVIVLQRWMLEHTWEYVLRARSEGQVVVNDIDDAFWNLDPRNHAWASSHPQLNPTSNTDHYLLCVLASDVVTVSTPFLANQMRSLLAEMKAGKPPEIVVLRNMIDLERWRPRREENERLTYGWVGAVPWRSGDVETLKPALGKFLAAHPEVEFRHSGHMDGDAIKTFAQLAGVDEGRVTKQGMAATYERMKLYYPIDVGLVPLNDLPFNHAKSAIKGMEYLAAGAPFMAADTPEYRWAAEQGMGCLVRGRAKAWSTVLGKFLDPDFRAAERARGIEALKAQDTRVRGVEWVDTYETALSAKRQMV